MNLIAFAFSLIHPALTEPTGDGFARGLNRVGVFLGWQIAAIGVSIVLFIIGLGQDKSKRGLRWLSRVPILLQGSLVLGFFALVAYVNLSKPPPQKDTPPTTQPVVPAPGDANESFLYISP